MKMKVGRSPNWDKLANRYKRASDQVGLVAAGVVAWAQDEAVAEERHQLDTLVYNAALPPSAGPGYERTGATRRAVTKGPLVRLPRSAVGTVFVDFGVANRDGFPYPKVLNRGRAGTTYWPRPFFTAALAIMRVRYRLKGREALKALKVALTI